MGDAVVSHDSHYVVRLQRRNLLPPDHSAVLIAGSSVRGWANAGSDLDFYIICRTDIGIPAERVTVDVKGSGQTRWDLHYWLEAQVDSVLDRVSWQHFDSDFSADSLLTSAEADLLETLTYAVPLVGEDWLGSRRLQIQQSAIKPVFVARALYGARVFAEDAQGQLASGDLESAVLSARLAFGCAVRALLADNGKFVRSPKWLARQLREIEQAVMPFAEYWDIETMRSYNPDDPGAWVNDVLFVCDRIALNVTV